MAHVIMIDWIDLVQVESSPNWRICGIVQVGEFKQIIHIDGVFDMFW